MRALGGVLVTLDISNGQDKTGQYAFDHMVRVPCNPDKRFLSRGGDTCLRPSPGPSHRALTSHPAGDREVLVGGGHDFALAGA